MNNIKTKRSISGIYFRYQNPVNNRWENWVFEDLPEEKQDEILSQKSDEFVRNLCKSLANTINSISEQFDITAEKAVNKGDRVTYCPSHGAKEKGIVKEVRDDIAFVVYNCDNNWNKYEDYTGAATNISDLKLGWID